jgi:hypothetical protein
MNIYVASSWRNERQPAVVEALRSAGHEVYDFRNPPSSTGFNWSEIDHEWQAWTPEQFREALEHPVAVDGFCSDMDALVACDACVLVLPCGRSAHLEAGWALGAGKHVIVLLSQCEPELMYRMTPHLCCSMDELLRCLEGLHYVLGCLRPFHGTCRSHPDH